MDSVSSFFSANPAVFTLLAVFVVVVIAFLILKKLIKFAVVIAFVILFAGGIYLFKDPGSVAGKIRHATQTLKEGKEQIGETLGSLFEDTKSLGRKISKVPGDLNKMLKTADEETEKEFKKK
ncbi:MAG TPA: hypothetical protein PLB14_03460 [Smithellaceae bacterium]|jgi:hypothetical protein|nr:hypothetical protein [Syntrophaceae bacterium]HPL97593.1 hypothetical protein [Smithellaceae bacterium]HPV48739.1 hypothetical protein [Smithellaceae bacterium]